MKTKALGVNVYWGILSVRSGLKVCQHVQKCWDMHHVICIMVQGVFRAGRALLEGGEVTT